METNKKSYTSIGSRCLMWLSANMLIFLIFGARTVSHSPVAGIVFLLLATVPSGILLFRLFHAKRVKGEVEMEVEVFDYQPRYGVILCSLLVWQVALGLFNVANWLTAGVFAFFLVGSNILLLEGEFEGANPLLMAAGYWPYDVLPYYPDNVLPARGSRVVFARKKPADGMLRVYRLAGGFFVEAPLAQDQGVSSPVPALGSADA